MITMNSYPSSSLIMSSQAGAPARQAPMAPRWDLSDLYSSPQDVRIEQDFLALEQKAKAFETQWKGKIQSLSSADFARTIDEYEAIDEGLGKIAAYAQLLFAAHTTDPETGRFLQKVQERMASLSGYLLFLSLEINRLDDAFVERLCQSPEVGKWASFIRDLRVFKPFQLSDEVERVLLELSVTGRQSWVRLFDETMAAMTAQIGGGDLPLGDVFNLLTDRDRQKRHEAAQSISDALSKQQKLLVMITNNLAKDKATMDKLRGYPRPVSSRNRANMVEDEVVDALVEAVDSSFPQLSHRYYKLKAQWLGLEKLEYWDRNAPLPQSDDAVISWDEGKEIVYQAYRNFDPEMGRLAQKFLTNPWIDASAAPGKSSGAFAHPVVPSVHPYLLMNYHGRARDVMTLAHEMGHGIHQILAGQAQGYLKSSTPLTLAETASVFGEMLTFQSLLKKTVSPERCRHLIASKVEDMLNTVVRQVAFYQFEVKVHAERQKGELSAEKMGDIWREVQERSLGPAFHFTPDYDLYWSYIPHFIHSPFYVYAYAFGDCLVNALYGVYCERPEGFSEKYKTMLAAGGTLRHRELLKPFGLDAGDPAFWHKGLKVIGGLIDQLEAGSL